MLDMYLIRTDPQGVAAALKKKGFHIDFTELLSWDEESRRMTTESEELRARRNKVSAEIPQLKKQGEEVSALLEEMKGIGDRIKTLEEERGVLEPDAGSRIALSGLKVSGGGC